MSARQAQEAIVENMTHWQNIEDAAVATTGEIIEKTDNPVIKLVMEIIQQDSRMHHRIQKAIADSLTEKAITLTPDELGAVWSMIEKHIAIEEKTVTLAKASLAATEGNKSLMVQRYLLEYLLIDEEKHDRLLGNLEAIKKDMYPYA